LRLDAIKLTSAIVANSEDLARYAAIPGIDLIVTNRKGIGLALNIGIEAARGEWIAFLDDDDLWEPSKLETQLRVANSANADVIFCDTINFGSGHKAIAPPLDPHPLSQREKLFFWRTMVEDARPRWFADLPF
jgi:glycosyltransferase involved in cell wall biosynthesis